MTNQEKIKKEKKIKIHKTQEDALEAKHEKAKKFIQSIDLSKLKELLAKNS